MQQGKSSLKFLSEPSIIGVGSVVGKKEGEGPLGKFFDEIEEDPLFGTDTWEKAESTMQKRALLLAIKNANIRPEDIRYLYAGDLLGQLIATSFGVMDLNIPLLGLYGACSTMGEALILSSMCIDSKNADYSGVITSSHYASAEKQFRFPLDYGNQRPFSSTWTVTGAGAVILGNTNGYARITGATVGKIVDLGVEDSMNMGAAMAPAACDTILRHFEDFNRKPTDYDKIITGDLGVIGQKILINLLAKEDIHIYEQSMDCGIEMYDNATQDTHAGGSGCGCSATTLCAFIIKKLQSGEWKRVLFIPTGALLSPTSFNEGQSVPGIAHAVVLECPKEVSSND
ncbi:Stage V sporulation protein AD (SpoVAD) [Lachnospiraceae bacterium TWA4]|nr:Stage V sporulation protein AD (SpoVAD) [Lachnospiraceae bacterium TWA4]